MPSDLFQRLSGLPLLKRAWHLARNDSRTDFMYDPFRFSDFGFHLEEHLQNLSQSLANGSYHPKPLLKIDVPKSSLAVRPGSVLEIDDKIVLFAIACLIAPPLDRKLPANVYSWRVKKNPKLNELFHDHEILEFTFLKGKTIRQKIEFVEPWYAAWPNFMGESEKLYEEQGYKILVVSDIVAYFENMDMDLLRTLLLQELPQQALIINFLINLLEYWAWPTPHGAVAPRGIPQGNGVSSFLGNFYLLPLDRAFVYLCKRLDLKYLRYMDDVKVLAKSRAPAREALFLMNDKLRGLRLNIQGAKTRILEGQDVQGELVDGRLVAVSKIIDEVKKIPNISSSDRKRCLTSLNAELKKVQGRKGIIGDKELRLFRRLMTGFAALRHSGMVRLVLDQLERNPDSRLLNSAVRYLRIQDRNLKRIPDRLTRLLANEQELFPYQQANFLLTLRYSRNIPDRAHKLARYLSTKKKAHWYVRQQGILQISFDDLSEKELKTFHRIYQGEVNPEVKRVWLQVLTQLPAAEIRAIAESAAFSGDQKLQRTGRFIRALLSDELRSREHIRALFAEITEDVLLDRFYQVEVLSRSEHRSVKQLLAKCLKKARNQVRRMVLKERVRRTIARLERELAGPELFVSPETNLTG